MMNKTSICRVAALVALNCAVAASVVAAESEIDLSETPIPFLKSEDLPKRVGALIELGRGINALGQLSPGIEMPGGAVLQPALWIYGSSRVAALTTDGNRRTLPGGDTAEVVTRLDLFVNLQLAGTERIFAHFRPLDESGRFAGTTLAGNPNASETHWETDWDIESLFFEGDFDELFPNMDPHDRRQLDFGLALGRIPVEFQNGYLIHDQVTGIGISKLLTQFPGSSGLRVLGVWGFDHINESNGARDSREVDLYGLFVEGDFPWGLLELDVGVTRADRSRGDQINFGIGWTGHFAGRNYSLHVNRSQHSDQDFSPETVCPGLNRRGNCQRKDYDGTLVVIGFSNEINPYHDLFYTNVYWADGDFGRLANSNNTPPLGPIGLAFAGAGMGSYRPALWPRPLDSAGISMGLQKFFSEDKANFVVEVAHREDLEKEDEFGDTGGTAVVIRMQRKFANRFLVQVDGYHAWHAEHDLLVRNAATGELVAVPQDAENDHASSAVRLELRMNF